MITLPRSGTLSRGPLRAFWVTMWLLVALGAGTAASRRGAGRAAVLGAAVFTAGAAPGLARPSIARRPYLTWAGGAGRAARVATGYTSWVAHTTAIAPRRSGRPERGDGGAGDPPSQWSPRGTQAPETYRSPSLSSSHVAHPGGVLRTVHRSLADSAIPRRRWLLVCLAVMRWLQPPSDETNAADIPTDTYTLY